MVKGLDILNLAMTVLLIFSDEDVICNPVVALSVFWDLYAFDYAIFLLVKLLLPLFLKLSSLFSVVPLLFPVQTNCFLPYS